LLTPEQFPSSGEEEMTLLDLVLVLVENLRLLILGPILVGVLAFAYGSMQAPVYTARTTLIPPAASSGGGGASVLAQLGGLGALAGLSMGGGLAASKLLVYLDSDVLRDKLIERFDLLKRWGLNEPHAARQRLQSAVAAVNNPKQGLLLIEVTLDDPLFAAELANAVVQELQGLFGSIQAQEAKARKVYLEQQLEEASRKPYRTPEIRDAIIQGMVRQLEQARLEEGSVGPKLEQVDVAEPPKFKSGPKRGLMAIISASAAAGLLLVFVFVRYALLQAAQQQSAAGKLSQIQRALRRAFFIPQA
jgi:uncharacterized protein involved in exopolysaccharide biosynthesis